MYTVHADLSSRKKTMKYIIFNFSSNLLLPNCQSRLDFVVVVLNEIKLKRLILKWTLTDSNNSVLLLFLQNMIMFRIMFLVLICIDLNLCFKADQTIDWLLSWSSFKGF